MSFVEITSTKNTLIKEIVEVKNSSDTRYSTKTILLEGLRLCLDAAFCGVVIKKLFLSKEALDKFQDKLSTLLNSTKEIYLISQRVVDYISSTSSSQGVFALVELPKFASLTDIDANGVYFLLDGVQDPGNVGTILRTAEGFGISGVVLSKGCADAFSQKVIRSSMGSVLRMQLILGHALTDVLSYMKKSGMRVLSACVDSTSISLDKLKNSGGIAVILGNEGAGVSAELIEACDEVFFIPMASSIESFNVAVSAAIVAWELRRI